MQDLIFKTIFYCLLLYYIVKKLNTFSKYICDIKLSLFTGLPFDKAIQAAGYSLWRLLFVLATETLIDQPL